VFFVLQPFKFLFIAISLCYIALGMLKPLTLRSFDRLFFSTFLTFLFPTFYKKKNQQPITALRDWQASCIFSSFHYEMLCREQERTSFFYNS